jgi:hypothetical protein
MCSSDDTKFIVYDSLSGPSIYLRGSSFHKVDCECEDEKLRQGGIGEDRRVAQQCQTFT